MRRFFCEHPIAGPVVVLTGPQAHHLLHVDRIQVGETVVLFDGSSVEHLARLVEAAGGSAQLQLLERIDRGGAPAIDVTLLAAVPKGKRMDVLVQMTCELGVATLVPIIAERSVVRPGPNKLEHWRRIVLESCKQCGRNLLMTVETPVGFADALAQPQSDALKLLLSIAGDARHISEVLSPRPAKAILLVGPEGGFSERESVAAVSAGFIPVSLGKNALRTETAAVCAAAVVLTVTG